MKQHSRLKGLRSGRASLVGCIGLSSLLGLAILGCSRESSGKSDGAGAGAPGADAAESAGPEKNPFGVDPNAAQNEIIAQSNGDLGSFQFTRTATRNFDELKESIASATCIGDTDRFSNNGQTFLQYYNNLAGNLPTTNDPSKYIAANVVGTMNLASGACKIALASGAAEKCGWSSGIEKEIDPELAFTEENIETLAKSVMNHFWGLDPSITDSSSQFVTDMITDVNELKKSIDTHLTESSNLSEADRKKRVVEGVLVSVCTAALSSSQFTTY